MARPLISRAAAVDRGLLALALVCLALGLWQLGGAAAIHGKAWLAQRLLDRAWAETLASGAPVKPWPWADTWPLARLQVPALAIDLYVLAGANGRTLAFGPAALDGTTGLSHQILSGHRDTHFAFLRDLEDGSRLRLQDRSGAWQDYLVRGHQVIDVRRPVLARPARGAGLLTLVTCYPFDAVEPGGPLRYAVTADALGTTPLTSQPLGKAAVTAITFGGQRGGEGIPDGAF